MRYLAAASAQSAEAPRRALSTYNERKGPAIVNAVQAALSARRSTTTPNTPVIERKLHFYDDATIVDA